MSDVNKTAIFTLELEADSWNQEVVTAKRNIESLGAELVKYQEKQKAGTKLTDEEIVAMTKLEAQLKANKAELNSLVAIQQKKNEADLAQEGSIKELNALYAAAEKELKRLGGTVEKTVTGELKLTNAQSEQSAELLQAYNTLKDYDAQLGRHQLNVGNYGGVLSKLKQQINELEQQRSIANDPDEVLRLTNEIRKAQFEFDKYTGKVDALGNRVAKNDIKDGFQDAASAASALTGGIGLLSLAMGDNSKAGETLQKVVVGLTLAQTALNVVKSKEDILGAATLIKDKALTAGKWLYAKAVEGATFAQKAFNATLIGVAVTGVVLAISKIVEAMNKQKNATQDAIDKQEEWKQQQQEITEKQVAQLLELEGQMIRVTDRMKNIRKGEAEGNDMTAARISLVEDEIKALDNLIAFENKRSEKYQQVTELIFEKNIELLELQTKAKKSRQEELDTTQKQVSEVILLTEAEKRYLNLKATGMLEVYGGTNGILEQIIEKEAGRTRSTAEAERAQMLLNDQIEKENALRLQTQDIIEGNIDQIYKLSDVFNNVFQAAAANAEDAQKEFFKSAIISFLDYLEAVVKMVKVEALVKQLASKGFAGIVTGGVIVGLIDAAFASLKSVVSGFAEGGLILPEHGIPITRDNGDNRLATVKTGEVIMNEQQQQGLKAVAGADIFKRLRIPGFAPGGMVLGDGGFTTRATVSKANQNVELRNALRDALQSLPPIYTDITEVTRAQDNYRKAELTARL